MIIKYPESLPKPLVSSTITLSESFKKIDDIKKFYASERIIKKHDTCSLSFKMSIDEFDKFENFIINELNGGFYSLEIEAITREGEQKSVVGDIFDGINVSVSPDAVSVSLQMIIKKI